jgi:hypothetical protein
MSKGAAAGWRREFLLEIGKRNKNGKGLPGLSGWGPGDRNTGVKRKT